MLVQLGSILAPFGKDLKGQARTENAVVAQMHAYSDIDSDTFWASFWHLFVFTFGVLGRKNVTFLVPWGSSVAPFAP